MVKLKKLLINKLYLIEYKGFFGNEKKRIGVFQDVEFVLGHTILIFARDSWGSGTFEIDQEEIIGLV